MACNWVEQVVYGFANSNPEEQEVGQLDACNSKDCGSDNTSCSDGQPQEAAVKYGVGPSQQEQEPPRVSTDQTKHKSQLCKKFMQYGCCPYEERCNFAHGPQQLKQNRNPNLKYKTKRCFAFFNEGYCNYGERCNYLHRKEPEGYANSTEQAIQMKKWAGIMKHNRHIIYQSRLQSRLPNCQLPGGN